MTRIAVNGAAGRMGTRIIALAKAAGDFEIAGTFDEAGPSRLTAETLKKAGKGVVIDFSSPEGTRAAVHAALEAGWGLVVGTTGLGAQEYDAVKKAAAKVPVIASSNMSVGVTLVVELLELLSRKMPGEFDLAIEETHHVHKKDAPSGTALMLLGAVGGPRRWDAARLEKEKARIKAIREGEVVGDHSVLFSTPAETIEIRHHARSRDNFAGGALVAARFIASAKPGLYSMADVLR